jgi:hypothetical protein
LAKQPRSRLEANEVRLRRSRGEKRNRDLAGRAVDEQAQIGAAVVADGESAARRRKDLYVGRN